MMLYSCTHMATVGVKGLTDNTGCMWLFLACVFAVGLMCDCDYSSADEHVITTKIHTSVRVHAFIGAYK